MKKRGEEKVEKRLVHERKKKENLNSASKVDNEGVLDTFLSVILLQFY